MNESTDQSTDQSTTNTTTNARIYEPVHLNVCLDMNESTNQPINQKQHDNQRVCTYVRQSKKRIGKAAKLWRRAAKVAGAENPDEMLKAYLESRSHHRPGGAPSPGSLVKRVLERVRIRPKTWKV